MSSLNQHPISPSLPSNTPSSIIPITNPLIPSSTSPDHTLYPHHQPISHPILSPITSILVPFQISHPIHTAVTLSFPFYYPLPLTTSPDMCIRVSVLWWILRVVYGLAGSFTEPHGKCMNIKTHTGDPIEYKTFLPSTTADTEPWEAHFPSPGASVQIRPLGLTSAEHLAMGQLKVHLFRSIWGARG